MKKNFNLDLTIEYPKLLEIVDSFIGKDKKKLIQFAIFESADPSVNDHDKWFINCPDINSNESVFEGECKFFIDYWRVSDESIFYPPITNPTWKDIIVACNELLQNGDECGVFLENVKRIGTTDCYELCIGS